MKKGPYRATHSVLLDDQKFRKLEPHARHLLHVLKITRLNNAAGIFVCDEGGIVTLSMQTGEPVERIRDAIEILSRHHYVYVEYPLIWLRNHLKHDPFINLKNENHRKSIYTILEGLPDCSLIAKFCNYYGLGIPSWIPSEYHRDTIEVPSGIKELELESELDTKNNSSSSKKSKNCYGDAVTEKSPKKNPEPPPTDRKPRYEPEEEFRREELKEFVEFLKMKVPCVKPVPPNEVYKFAAWFARKFRSEPRPVLVAMHVIKYRLKYIKHLKTGEDLYKYVQRIDQDAETVNEARSVAYKSIPPVDVGLDKKPP